uniref:Uncharacterized protein n=1 Tax=Lepeophtheirus salmonis TaxID=72036 RepID=A0A0K2U3W7_LEPSM
MTMINYRATIQWDLSKYNNYPKPLLPYSFALIKYKQYSSFIILSLFSFFLLL